MWNARLKPTKPDVTAPTSHAAGRGNVATVSSTTGNVVSFPLAYSHLKWKELTTDH